MARHPHDPTRSDALARLGLFMVVASVLLALSLGNAELFRLQPTTPDLAQRLHSLLAGIRLWS